MDTIDVSDGEDIPTATTPKRLSDVLIDDQIDAKRVKRQPNPTDNHFRCLPSYPTVEEILDVKEPWIRSNVVKGPYDSVDHYLDIHYRLLRHDFVAPLRRGIQEYLRYVQTDRLSDKLMDINIYNGVRIGSKRDKSSAAYSVTFDATNMSDNEWGSTDRLLYGSLVCLSSDRFATLVFGTITGNGRESDRKKGNFQLRFESPVMAKDMTAIDVLSSAEKKLFDETYVMIESKTYFEAYRHILAALQRIQCEDFPLKRYIIDVQNQVLSPSCITSNTVYDLSHMMAAQPKTDTDDCEILYDTKFDCKQHKNVRLIDDNNWPHRESLGLDDSQYEAFQFALRKELVLIQGPPGTGKTYVGLKIVQTLIANRYHKTRPILIVCYTNHALDQFLSGILMFSKRLLRLGGGCKNDLLKSYTLRHHRRHRKSLDKVIRSKEIIGMTTTGAAKFRGLLEKVGPKIVIIEEAAEVLESHVIAAITKHTEQLILIGDHQQLRPQTADYEMARTHKLDISLFERLIQNGFPYKQLKLQHRMRPEISALLTPHIYQELFNHNTVYQYLPVRGMYRSMYFVNHSHNESVNDERMSRSNEFEAKFLVALTKHLIYQNYDKNRITILTLYSSQSLLIRRLLRSDSFYDGINCEVLDGFQGEENDIILVSFVRSNASNDIGFLKIANRINVALSRAKCGLYCIGNFDGLSAKSSVWHNIYDYLKRVDSVGPELPLKCIKHQNKRLFVSKAEDFDVISFGGCGEPCDELMSCGHSCSFGTCHPLTHQQIKCQIKCKEVVCHLSHNCDQYCHLPDPCPPCDLIIDKKMPFCGHTIREKCSSDGFCTHPCDKGLDCGHECHNRCGEDCQVICTEKVNKIVKDCGHKLVVDCRTTAIVCHYPCDNWLLCGHKCPFKCSDECADKCRDCYDLDSNNTQTKDFICIDSQVIDSKYNCEI